MRRGWANVLAHSAQFEDAGVHRPALLQGGPQGAVEAVLEVVVPAPRDDVGEEIAIEGRILLQKRLEIQGSLGGNQLVESDLLRRDGRPLPLSVAMVGVRPDVTDSLEDHAHNFRR